MKKANKYPLTPLLVVDDEENCLQGMEIALKASGINNIILCSDSRRVIEILDRQQIEIILLDLTMPYVSGQELLNTISHEFPDIPVIVTTGMNELDTAVSCMATGAFDYMVKPVSRERLISGAGRAIEVRELRRENSLLKEHVLSNDLKHPEAFDAFDSVDPSMRAIFKYAESIARSMEPILVTGETGVGKEVMAQCIYKLSETNGPFVPVNVAGLDDNAFSDTLFGHRKGAFTGALEVRKGLIERASEGILFLDEIGDLNSILQVKLLRLLQEREYLPLGSDVPSHTSARIIVATNKDIHSLVESGAFRKDLYYRLRHHHIHIPPLRERPDDLPLLINRFFRSTASKLAIPQPAIPLELPSLLSSYSFPGNVRELDAMINDGLSSLSGSRVSLRPFKTWIGKNPDGILDAAASPSSSSQDAPGDNSDPLSPFGNKLPTLKEAQDLLMSEALKRSGNNQSAAAQLLGISRQALNKRLRRKPGSAPQEACATSS